MLGGLDSTVEPTMVQIGGLITTKPYGNIWTWDFIFEVFFLWGVGDWLAFLLFLF